MRLCLTIYTIGARKIVVTIWSFSSAMASFNEASKEVRIRVFSLTAALTGVYEADEELVCKV